MSSFFEKMFDLNGDGKLDARERFHAKMAFETVTGSDVFFDETEEEMETADIDEFDLELMDEDERREALEEEGLDPDDYEDYDEYDDF